MLLIGLRQSEQLFASGLRPYPQYLRRELVIMFTSANARHTDEEVEALNKMPWLANPLLKFDLPHELEDLRRKESWDRETGRSSKTLAKHPDFRIVLVLMKANTHMNQHRAEGRISIHQLLGKISVRLADQQVNLSEGELLVLDCGVLHDFEALEESAFLLTISWSNGRRNSRGPAEVAADRSFDEEALSRMENEGATDKPLV
jgi:quercetin dioxygenase-like cupin family protein